MVEVAPELGSRGSPSWVPFFRALLLQAKEAAGNHKQHNHQDLIVRRVHNPTCSERFHVMPNKREHEASFD